MEGPSLVILKEQAAKFIGKKILEARGAANVDMDRITGKKLKGIETWGKHLLILLDDCIIKVHYLMFGTYLIDRAHAGKVPKLTLRFVNGEWNNYTCAVKILEETDPDTLYDFSCDLMQDSWDPKAARKKILEHPERQICDVLLDQQIFSGLGNIMKNEILYRTRIQPETKAGAIPPRLLTSLIREARQYAFDFLKWKKENKLKKHWEAHTKRVCLRCQLPLVKKHTGKTPRRSFFCEGCQVLY